MGFVINKKNAANFLYCIFSLLWGLRVKPAMTKEGVSDRQNTNLAFFDRRKSATCAGQGINYLFPRINSLFLRINSLFPRINGLFPRIK
jgi:hypothetical protein